MGYKYINLGIIMAICMFNSTKYFFILMLPFALWGCRTLPQFPERAMRVEPSSDGSQWITFDTNKDRNPDYWQREDISGRKVELRFAQTSRHAEQHVLLDEIDHSQVPHFIIALDGVPYRLIKELYDQGCFRLFYPPGKLVSTFPAMTDLAFHRLIGGKKPIAYQARHFDRQKNRFISGNDAYLSGAAADWAKKLDYRCSFMWDTVAYINPQMVFDHELEGMMSVFRRCQNGKKIVYSVGTAGLGTRGGREAILKYLRVIDQFCEQIVYERKGKVKITLLADHGHNMSGRGRVNFEQLLKQQGYRLADRLEEPRDVVTIKYGLVTYAAFFTDEPASVTRVLLTDPVTTLACYPQNNTIIVETIDGKAHIHEKNGNYRYQVEYGDPLALNEIITSLQRLGKVDEQGFIDDRALLQATTRHLYPDPLHRIWLAFNGLVHKPADLIVCLKDGWVHGSAFFHTMIGGATSTHGSLNYINSMTFVMSMQKPTPSILRLDDVMPYFD